MPRLRMAGAEEGDDMKGSAKTKPTNVTLGLRPELYQRCKALARSSGQSTHRWMTQAVVDACDRADPLVRMEADIREAARRTYLDGVTLPALPEEVLAAICPRYPEVAMGPTIHARLEDAWSETWVECVEVGGAP